MSLNKWSFKRCPQLSDCVCHKVFGWMTIHSHRGSLSRIFARDTLAKIRDNEPLFECTVAQPNTLWETVTELGTQLLKVHLFSDMCLRMCLIISLHRNWGISYVSMKKYILTCSRAERCDLSPAIPLHLTFFLISPCAYICHCLSSSRSLCIALTQHHAATHSLRLCLRVSTDLLF